MSAFDHAGALIEAATKVADAEGVVPVGDIVVGTLDVNPAGIPQTLGELGELESYTYDLTVRQAGELNIPVVGSVSGGANRRVVIYEWTRYKEVPGTDGVVYRYGYTIRFCLTISNFDATGKLSLSFLSAQAEIGSIQASWLMQVRGLTGSKIDAVVLPPQDLDVKTFVIAQQSLAAAITAVNDTTTRFVPGIVVGKREPFSTEERYRAAAISAYACFSITKGRSRADCISRLGSPDSSATDVITDVYTHLGIADPTTQPPADARQRARGILGGIRADL